MEEYYVKAKKELKIGKAAGPDDIPPERILTLRRIIEGVKDNNLKAVMAFIDFKKAFDCMYIEVKCLIFSAHTEYHQT